jgi:hypothetical protein
VTVRSPATLAVAVGPLAALLVAALYAPSRAQPAASASPVPSPSAAAASGPSDPCTTLLAVVTRPTVTTAVCAVKRGHWLVESGYENVATTGDGGGVTAGYPQTLIRVGSFVPNVEIDVVPPSFQRSSIGGSVASGASDTSFGAKWEIGYTTKAAYGVNVFATEPTGDRAFTAGSPTYAGNINGAYTISPEFSLGSTLSFQTIGALAPGGAALRGGSFVPSLALFATLPANSQLFGEIAYFSHAGVGLPGRTLYDFGYQKDVSMHVQLDVELGFAPTPIEGQRQHYLGFGLAAGDL